MERPAKLQTSLSPDEPGALHVETNPTRGGPCRGRFRGTSNIANAAPVFTPLGGPFPTGATVTIGGVFGMIVDTTFGVNPQYGANGGPFVDLPQRPANSTPPAAPSAVPEIDALAGTGALILLGFGLALAGERRHRGTAAPILLNR